MPHAGLTALELLEQGDLEGFLAWHRSQPYHGATMTTPPPPPATPPAAPPDPAAAALGVPPAAPGTPPAGGEKYVPQSEVDRIAAREKDQGKRAGQRAALEALGFDPEKVKLEDVKKTLDGVATAELERMSEVERRELAATQREQAAAERESAANEVARQARLTGALLRAGAPDASLDDARTLLSTVPADADESAIVEAVGKLKERLPALFTGSAPPPPPGGGTFTGTPPRPQANGDAMQRGAERARAMGLAPKADATP